MHIDPSFQFKISRIILKNHTNTHIKKSGQRRLFDVKTKLRLTDITGVVTATLLVCLIIINFS